MMAQINKTRNPYDEIVLKRKLADKSLKQQIKDFKKDEMNRTFFTMMIYYLKISSIRVAAYSYETNWIYKVRVFNPYNPLSYIIIGILFIPSVLRSGITETIKGISRSFKYI